MIRPLAALLILLVCACESEDRFFAEPLYERTFTYTRGLRSGETIEVIVRDLGSNQRLRFHQCGPKCNSATTVDTWTNNDLPTDGEVSIKILQDAEFYFWVEKLSDNPDQRGEAVVPSSYHNVDEWLVLEYSSGLNIRLRLNPI